MPECDVKAGKVSLCVCVGGVVGGWAMPAAGLGWSGRCAGGDTPALQPHGTSLEHLVLCTSHEWGKVCARVVVRAPKTNLTRACAFVPAAACVLCYCLHNTINPSGSCSGWMRASAALMGRPLTWPPAHHRAFHPSTGGTPARDRWRAPSAERSNSSTPRGTEQGQNGGTLCAASRL